MVDVTAEVEMERLISEASGEVTQLSAAYHHGWERPDVVNCRACTVIAARARLTA